MCASQHTSADTNVPRCRSSASVTQIRCAAVDSSASNSPSCSSTTLYMQACAAIAVGKPAGNAAGNSLCPVAITKANPATKQTSHNHEHHATHTCCITPSRCPACRNQTQCLQDNACCAVACALARQEAREIKRPCGQQYRSKAAICLYWW